MKQEHVEETVNPKVREARAALSRIEHRYSRRAERYRMLAAQWRVAGHVARAEKLELYASRLVAHWDDELPAEEDALFQLARMAHPGRCHLEIIGTFLRSKYMGGKTQLTRERVRQIEEMAMEKLRRAVRSGDIQADDVRDLLHERDKASSMHYADGEDDGGWPTKEDAARARDPMSEKLYPNRFAARASWGTRLGKAS
jgi:hypothetical protein